jgi:putative drug exporter of the RND superfamily
VPAIMFLLGKANWWFPSWLDKRLPRLGIDAAAVEGASVEDVAAPEPDAVPA